MSKPPAARGHSRKHSRNRPRKHHQHPAHSKHNPGHQAQGAGASGSGGPQKVHTVAHHHQQPKPRGFSPGYDVECCAAEALGTLLALSGRPVSHEDTLALYWRTASHPDDGASILATLEAASEFPELAYQPRDAFLELITRRDVVAVEVCPCAEVRLDVAAWLAAVQPDAEETVTARLAATVTSPVDITGHGLILGVTIPEPHAVAVGPDGRWWSWGEPFDPAAWPELVIEEAWAVSL